jgi:hypothetical protein
MKLIRKSTMKPAIALAALGLVLFGLADAADADVFSPASTKFNLTGPVIIMKSGVKLGCQETVGAQTNATGALSITSMSFSGGQGCSSVKANGLPWAVNATGISSLTISKVLLMRLRTRRRTGQSRRRRACLQRRQQSGRLLDRRRSQEHANGQDSSLRARDRCPTTAGIAGKTWVRSHAGLDWI